MSAGRPASVASSSGRPSRSVPLNECTLELPALLAMFRRERADAPAPLLATAREAARAATRSIFFGATGGGAAGERFGIRRDSADMRREGGQQRTMDEQILPHVAAARTFNT